MLAVNGYRDIKSPADRTQDIIALDQQTYVYNSEFHYCYLYALQTKVYV
jgi:hypothetical protein